LLKQRHLIEQHQAALTSSSIKSKPRCRTAERATFKTGSVTWKKSRTPSLDSKALLQQHPEFLQQFPQNKQGTRLRFIYGMMISPNKLA
jgi:hypothetical protein